jgi:hypothetical protein
MFAGVPKELQKAQRLPCGPENLLGRFQGTKELRKQLKHQNSTPLFQVKKDAPSSSSSSLRSTKSVDQKARSQSGSAFTYPTEVHLDKWEARRTFKVVGFTTDISGVKNLFDISTGESIKSGCMSKPRITKNVVTFDSKEAALMEQINNKLPRVLAAFGVYFCDR